MIVKLIKISTTPEKRSAFIRCQEQWNDAMARCSGFVTAVVAANEENSHEIHIIAIWQDRASLDAFMREQHDSVQAASGIRATYDAINVTFHDVLQVTRGFPAVGPPQANSAQTISQLSEAYRASIIVRAALAGGIFSGLAAGPMRIEDLARRVGVRARYVDRLVRANATLNLLTLDGDLVSLTDAARQHLVEDNPGFLGHLVMHNTRPALLARWQSLPNQLGMAETSFGADDHDVFVRAMHEIARAGQADQLVENVNLSSRRHLLDVGGALGDYAIALVKAWPLLHADVLDLQQTTAAARANIAQSDAAARIEFIAGDYRKSLPEHDYDVILVSNVLRGEVPQEAFALIARIHRRLRPGGLLIVQDLFSDQLAGASGSAAAFFGLHLPDSWNPSSTALAHSLTSVGFQDVQITPLQNPIVADKLLLATRA